MSKRLSGAWLLIALCTAGFLARCGGNGVALPDEDLAPQADSRVRMVSEDVVFTREAPGGYDILAEGYWSVRAAHQMRNESAERIRLQMGVPEPACSEEEDCGFAEFHDLTTTVRGTPVKLKTGEVRSDHDWAGRVAKVHLFEVTFEPEETVEIVHSYRHGLSEQAVGGEHLRYVTVTGKPWADTIGSARFRIQLPFRPWGITLAAWQPYLTSLSERWEAGHSQVEIVLDRTNWEPEEDIEVYLGPGYPTLDSPPLVEGCPDFFELLNRAETEDQLDPAALAERMKAVSTEKLRDCRNAIFAHHGYVFRDEKLNERFYGETGLNVTANTVFARNPAFTAEMLSETEELYAKAVEMIEHAR